MHSKSKILALLIVSVFFLGLVSGILILTLFTTPESLPVQQKIPEITAQQKEPLKAGTFTAQVNIVAVTSNGEGMLSSAEVEISDGKGRILFNTNPFVEPDTQYSIETAKEVAQKVTGKDCSGKDFIYSIDAGDAKLVGGPSAGAALTIATIAAIEEKPVREDIAITGTINKNGSIGQIGGVIEKARAAGEHGIKLFLVPKGQSIATVYEKKTEEKRGKGFYWQRTWYEPKTIDLNAAMFEQYGMQVKEVSNIYEALKYAL